MEPAIDILEPLISILMEKKTAFWITSDLIKDRRCSHQCIGISGVACKGLQITVEWFTKVIHGTDDFLGLDEPGVVFRCKIHENQPL